MACKLEVFGGRASDHFITNGQRLALRFFCRINELQSLSREAIISHICILDCRLGFLIENDLPDLHGLGKQLYTLSLMKLKHKLVFRGLTR